MAQEEQTVSAEAARGEPERILGAARLDTAERNRRVPAGVEVALDGRVERIAACPIAAAVRAIVLSPAKPGLPAARPRRPPSDARN
jgi:hypothetical protein